MKGFYSLLTAMKSWVAIGLCWMLLSVQSSFAQDCPAPTGLSVTSLSSNSAVLLWTQPDAGEQMQYDYAVSSNPITSANWSSLSASAAGVVAYGTKQALDVTQLSLTDLQPGTLYYVLLRQNCEWDYSGSSSFLTTTFSTMCEPVALPIDTMKFASATFPACWLMGGTILPVLQNSVYYGSEGYAVKLQNATDASSMLFTPALQGASSASELVFRAYSSSGRQRFVVGVAPIDGDITTDIVPIYEDSTIANQWIEFVVSDKDGYFTDGYVYVIYAEQGNPSTFYVDDILVREASACRRPSSLQVSGVGETSATFSWTENGTATAWVLELTPEGGSAFTENADANPFTCTSLEQNTDYTARVKASCGDSESDYAAVSVSFKTECGAQPIPFEADFDSYSIGDVPDCFTVHKDGESRVMVKSDNNTSSNTLTLREYKNTSPVYAVLPRFDADLRTLRMRFSYRYESASYGWAEVGYMTDKSDVSTFVILDTLDRTAVYTQYAILLEEAPQNAYIAVRYGGIAFSYYDVMIDNLYVEPAPTCKAPVGLQLSSVAATSATFSWTQPSTAPEWEVVWTRGVDTGKEMVTSPSFTMSGLEESTSYAVGLQVRAICQEGDTSEVTSSSISFKTRCAAVALPFYESFDALSSTQIPDCWDNSLDADIQQRWWSSGAGYDDTRGIAYYASSSSSSYVGQRCLLMTPTLELTENSRLSFHFLNGYPLQARFSVWVHTDGNMNVADTLASALSSSAWEQKTYDLSAYTGKNIIVVFAATTLGGETAGSSVLLDNVEVSALSACPPPEKVWVEDVTATSAKIFVKGGDGTIVAEYGEGLSVSVPKTSDTTIVTLTGLQETTSYSVTVYAQYDAEHKSRTVDPVSFMTNQVPASLPYSSTDFSDWLLVNGTEVNYWNVDNDSLCIFNGDTKTKGYKFKKATTSDSEPVVTSNVYAVRSFGVDEEGSYSVQFKWRAGGESTYDFLWALVAPASATVEAGKSIKSKIPDGWTKLGKAEEYLNLKTSLQSFEYDVNLSAGDYKLLLYWCNDYASGTQPGAIVSDVSIRKLSCAYPNVPTVTALSYDSVALSWNSTGADSYEMKVFEGTTLPADIDTASSAFERAGLTATDIVFKGLSPQTDYIAVVRADCGADGKSKWSEPRSFKTLCAPELLPYTDGFETDNTSYDCWTVNTSENGYFAKNTTRFHTGNASVYGHNATFTSMALTFPEGKNLSDYLIAGFAQPYTAGVSFSIGIQKSITDATTYLQVATVALADAESWTEFTASFAPLASLPDAADYKYVVINLNSETNICIDDISIEEIPSCPRPSVVMASDITENSAVVDWTPMGTETKWEVVVMDGTDVHKKEIVTAHPHTVTDLQAMTSYAVQVRAICAEEDTSAVRDCSFKTLCSAMALPYMEDFNSLTEGIPDCWNNEEGTTTELAKRWNYSAKGYNNTACVCFNSWNNASGNTNFLTTVPVKITEAAQLSFVYKKQTGSGLDVYLSLDGGLTMADTLAEKIPGEGIGNPGWKDTVLYIDDRFVGSIVSIVFKGTSNYGSSDAYIYLDNLVLEAAPACILSPTLKVEVANVSSDTAKLVVSDAAQDTLRWEYAIAKGNQNVTEVTPISADSDVIVLRDLEPATRYSVYVRHYCDEENVSSWTAAVPFKTACAAGELPLTENFNSLKDGIPDCWDNEEGTTTDVTNRWNYYADGYNSTACLRFNSYYYSNPSGNTNFLKLPSVNLSEKARVSFVYKKIDGSVLDVYLSVDGGTTYADTLAENLPATSGQWTKVLYGIDDRFVGSVVTIVFKATSNGSYSSNGYIYLDNVVLEAVPDCEMPKGTSIVWRDRTSVTFAVQRDDDQTDCTYEYAFVVAGGDVDTATVTACLSDTVTISSLTPQTDYLLYVRTVCANGKRSAWLSPIEFSTLCNALELPYTENFGTTSIMQNGAVVMPSCWSAYNWVNTITSENVYTQSYVRVASASTYSTNYGRSGNYLYFMAYGYGARRPIYAVMPEFTTPLNQIEISFSTKFDGTSKDSLVLGYLTDVKDNSSFVEIVTVPNATSLTDHTFALGDYGAPAITAPLAFRYVATSSYYRVGVDAVSVRILDYPIGLKVTDLDFESATISWMSFREAPAYEALLIHGTDTVKHRVSGTSESLTGLLPMTEYRYKVRAIIAEGDTSAWSKELTFATPQPAAALPYSCNFEDDTENAYWQMANGTINKWVIDTAAVKDDLKGLYISNDGGKTNAYSSTSSVVSYTFRRFDLSRGNYLVSFDWRSNGEHSSYGCYDYLAVFLVPESEQIVADKYGSSSATVAPENWIPVKNGDALPYTLATNWQLAQNVVAVPEAGKYNLVFMWKNDGSTTNDPPAAIDNISVSEVNCIPVSGLLMTSLHSTSVGFKWNKNDSETYQVACLRAGTAMDDVLAGSLPTTTDSVLTLDTLQVMTSYTLYVRSACGEGEVSDWMQLSFKTPDVAKDLPYSTGFEEGQDQSWSFVQNDDATNKWYVGEAGVKDGVRGLYISADGGTNNTYEKASDIVYAVRSFNAETAGEYTFEFDYKCEGDYYESYYDGYSYDVPLAYLSTYIVPSTETVSAGEDAESKWTSLLTEEYSITTWKHLTKTIYIETPGVYSLAFQWYSKSSYYATSGKGGAAVDNVSIQQVPCTSLQNKPVVSHIGSNSATLSWERESDGVQIRLGTSSDIATTGTALLDTIVTLNTVCPLKGLEPSTEYYVAVRSVCQSGETFAYSPTWKTVNFKTLCSVLRLPYIEDFEDDVKYDACWSLYKTLFTGTEMQALPVTTYNAWMQATTGYGISDKHMKLNIYGTELNDWLVTPSIYIDNADANLMFDIALTDYRNSDPIEDATAQADDRFIVFVSPDNGNTWSLSHAREWNNTGSEYVYNEIPNTASTVTMSLADYAGDTIRIAFYGESTASGGDNDMHIGNLQVFNGTVEEVKDTICANTDYMAHGFSILKDNLTPGMEYNRSQFNTVDGVTTLYNLSLYVLPEAKVEVRDTVCANTPYEKYGFQIANPQTRTYTLSEGVLQTAYGCDSLVVLHLFVPETQFNQQLTICDTETPYAFGELSLTESGVYVQTFQGSLCDSTVTLDLTVLPTRTETSKTICEGESFSIGTESFSTQGDHEVTLKNVLGCDSTIVLHLTVQSTEGSTYTGYVCQGGTYYDDNFPALTEAGTYDRTLISSLGCDSIVHLNLVVLEPQTSSIQETICNGDIYRFDGKDLVSEGDYTGRFTSALGCDSVVTLHLTVLPTPEVSQELTLTTDQLPYTFATTADSTYIIEEMREGTYWPEIVLANAAENGCDSIVNLTLHIKLPESVDYVSEGRLDIVPNIIDREGTVFIRNTFTASDKEGVTVELFDAVGRRVSLQTLSGRDMTVEGFHNSGMYLLRVTDGDKRTFIGQVIVR